ncbi:hypothetical protein THAOC_32133 [Thalassiosira oceanica]|uniref:Uncharacterized protein n=1 Tax=Thalassiosira oceanica TaxID=159749 RepID=K0R6M5_THAOC|nr:hypothetical protein THAOC_32133 [Thalassiosira oceanica]|eukprot:EJK49028.1 hypothetical protein THAOC_32133 [Thalassiosira oceanica]
MAAGECDIWILRVKLLWRRPRQGSGDLSMSRTEVSFSPYDCAALSGVQLRGQNRQSSRDRRPWRMPESESAVDSGLEYTPPLPPWCTSGQYWPSSDWSSFVLCRVGFWPARRRRPLASATLAYGTQDRVEHDRSPPEASLFVSTPGPTRPPPR